jgi:hypothetical protein
MCVFGQRVMGLGGEGVRCLRRGSPRGTMVCIKTVYYTRGGRERGMEREISREKRAMFQLDPLQRCADGAGSSLGATCAVMRHATKPVCSEPRNWNESDHDASPRGAVQVPCSRILQVSRESEERERH